MRTSDWSSDVCSSDLVVVEPGLSPLKQFDLLTEEQLYHAQDEYGDDAFVAKIGAEAIRDLLGAIDLEKERENIRQELAETTSELKPKKLVKRLKLVESFIDSGNRPEWMVLTVRSVEHTSELQSLMRISYAVFCLKKK